MYAKKKSCDRILLFLLNQHKVANVNQKRERLADDEHGVTHMKGVDQDRDAARNAQIPKLDGHHAPLVPFGMDPLHKKPKKKQKLREKSEDHPPIPKMKPIKKRDNHILQPAYHVSGSAATRLAGQKSILLPSWSGFSHPPKTPRFSHLSPQVLSPAQPLPVES